MSHSHSHHHDTSKNIKTAFFLNLAFTILEIFGGLWTNSLAILSDAVHDLGDSISLGLAWYLDSYAQRGEDDRFSYGYRRFSLLGALINTIILIVGGLFVITQAIPRLIAPEHANAPGMVLFAIVGILVNGAAVLRLKDSQSINAKVVAWHLLEDVLGWVAVLIVAIILLFVDIPILDPILSVLISLYILYNVVKNLRDTLALFLQAVPKDIEIKIIKDQLLGIEDVKSTHHIHIWSLDGEHNVLTAHVVVDEAVTKEEILCIKGEVREVLRDHDFTHITVEIEYGDGDCAMG
ncbi:MAG: cation diffusion facilitator family transporter [Chloroflexi bacterium]|nr:cation diffusion facilitator family transporter [Chloroflexota bacterium]